jgi:hypothetical protein
MNPFVRWGAASALGASLAWAALSLESIARPDPEDYRSVLFLVPWLLSAAGLAGLHAAQSKRSGRFGKIAFWMTLSTMAALTVGTLAAAAEIDFIERLLFPSGILIWVVGMTALGVAMMRAGVVPRRVGVALILSEPLTILTAVALSPWIPLANEGSYTGTLAHAVVFLVVGLAMRGVSGEPAVSTRPSALELSASARN